MNDNRSNKVLEENVKRLAETTDVSPNQARELLDRYGGDFELAKREARNFKAES
jgi:hypothetical protein